MTKPYLSVSLNKSAGQMLLRLAEETRLPRARVLEDLLAAEFDRRGLNANRDCTIAVDSEKVTLTFHDSASNLSESFSYTLKTAIELAGVLEKIAEEGGSYLDIDAGWLAFQRAGHGVRIEKRDGPAPRLSMTISVSAARRLALEIAKTVNPMPKLSVAG